MAEDRETKQDTTYDVNRLSGDFWLRLDNAAKIYPAIQTEEMTAVFRLSAVLNERIRINPLLEAIARLENRFPYYKMKPRQGFFWYYLQYYHERITVIPDTGIPCRAFASDELFFRILVKGNKVSVEFSHILTDGAGGFEFLRSLLMTYFEACGVHFTAEASFMRPDEKISEEEFEDAFGKNFQMDLPAPVRIRKSFHLTYPLKSTPRFGVMSFLVDIEGLMSQAKHFQVSLTVYLVGVYLFSLQNIYNRMATRRQHRRRKIFRIHLIIPITLPMKWSFRFTGSSARRWQARI